MRKLLYLFTFAIVLYSCSGRNEYVIKGVVPNPEFEGTKVYLQQISDNETMVVTDSTLVENGAFVFFGSLDSVRLRFVSLDESITSLPENRVPILLEQGSTSITFDSVTTVRGTKINEAYNVFRTKKRDLDMRFRNLSEQLSNAAITGTLTEEMRTEIDEIAEKINNEEIALNYDFILNNVGNELGQFTFIESSSIFEPDQLNEILDRVNDSFMSHHKVQKVIKRLENMEAVAIGKRFVDFTLKNSEGKDVSLSDYAGRGKYLLVDFWAAWCPPCRREMPNVVAAYEKYNSRGFEVIGVSFDHNREQWLTGIDTLNMTWPQLSDLMYWDSPIVELYAIQSIPHTVLLDKEGVIIEKNLRGDALDARLAELMPD